MTKDLYIVMILNIVITLVTVLLQEYDRVQAFTHSMVIAIFVAIFGILCTLIWLILGEIHGRNEENQTGL